MKTQLCRLVLCSTAMYFICLNLPVLPASPGIETHLCGFSEQQTINRRYARTFANLEVGVPRTVRLVYLLPVDRPPRGGIGEKMDALIRDVREFYADQMENHGFGRKSFSTEDSRRLHVRAMMEIIPSPEVSRLSWSRSPTQNAQHGME